MTRELQPILVELLGRHRREHAAQVTLERLLGDARDLAAVLAEEALDRVADEARGRSTTLMFAIACTLSGMPPSEYAPCTAIGTEISDTSMRLTVSTTGIAHAAPAEHDAIADAAAIGRRVLAAREDQDLVRPADAQQVAIDDHQHEAARRQPATTPTTLRR